MTETTEKKRIYFNKPQLETMAIAAHTTVIVGGRRLGKTHGIAAPWLLRNTQAMPGCAIGIVGASFQQILTRTLPGTFKALEDMGYYRNVHYMVGVVPPKSWRDKMVREPIKYDHVVSWYNGTCWYLISQDIPGSSNSLTLQAIFGDEAKFLDFEKLKDETFPANGGFKGPWKNCPWLNSMLFISDMPTSKKGSWFLSFREKMDKDVIEAIKGMVIKIAELRTAKKTTYTKRKLREYRLKLAQLRSVAVYYREISTIENIALLGKKYIAQMKRDLPPLVFLTSILCVRPGKLKDGFYPSFSDARHTYKAFNNDYLKSLEFDLDKASEAKCRQDGDLDPKKPICVAFDYNSNINWLVAGQPRGTKAMVLKSFYVKYQRKLRELVYDFCDYYQYHPTKEVVFYYDSTALGSNYAVNEEDFSAVIKAQFEKHRWRVNEVYMGKQLRQHEKYTIVDQAFKGQKYMKPMINEPNNEALILGIQQAGVRIGRNGWEKDKTGEKLQENEESLLEHRTDGTDAFDTLMIGMFLYPHSGVSSAVGGSGFIKLG